jgi:hypothetical protein
MCFAYWITKARIQTHTHFEYVILSALPWQHWIRERASMLRYTYIARPVRILPTTTATLLLPTGLTNRRESLRSPINFFAPVKVNGNMTASYKTETTFFLVLSSSYFSFFLLFLLISSSYLNFYISSFCSFFSSYSRSLLFALSYHKYVFSRQERTLNIANVGPNLHSSAVPNSDS